MWNNASGTPIKFKPFCCPPQVGTLVRGEGAHAGLYFISGGPLKQSLYSGTPLAGENKRETARRGRFRSRYICSGNAALHLFQLRVFFCARYFLHKIKNAKTHKYKNTQIQKYKYKNKNTNIQKCKKIARAKKNSAKNKLFAETRTCTRIFNHTGYGNQTPCWSLRQEGRTMQTLRPREQRRGCNDFKRIQKFCEP